MSRTSDHADHKWKTSTADWLAQAMDNRARAMSRNELLADQVDLVATFFEELATMGEPSPLSHAQTLREAANIIRGM